VCVYAINPLNKRETWAPRERDCVWDAHALVKREAQAVSSAFAGESAVLY
jgi:hypothetical protein